MNLTDLQTFVLVTRTGSLSGAAKELKVPTSTVSRRVARLEADLGTALLLRTGRSVSLTDAGRTLGQRTEPSLRDIREAGRALLDDHRAPTGTLRIALSSALMTPWLARLLTSYRARYPHVHLETRISDQLENGYDLALTTTRPSRAGLSCKVIGDEKGHLFASPSYLEENGTPGSPTDLSEHDCICTQDRGPLWALKREGEEEAISVSIAMTSDEAHLLVPLLVEGAGIGLLPECMASPYVDRGELIRVLPDWSSDERAIYLVWPDSPHISPRVRAFIDHAPKR